MNPPFTRKQDVTHILHAFEQSSSEAKPSKRTVTADDGTYRRVWTDPATGHEVFEFAMRPEEEIESMKNLVHIWLRYCKDKMDGPQTFISSSGENIEAVQLFHVDDLKEIERFPEIKTMADYRLGVAKAEALRWVLGDEFGWPNDRNDWNGVEPTKTPAG